MLILNITKVKERYTSSKHAVRERKSCSWDLI